MTNEVVLKAQKEAEKIIENAKLEAKKMLYESSLIKEVNKLAQKIKEDTLKECEEIKQKQLDNLCFSKYSSTCYLEKNLWTVKSKINNKFALMNDKAISLTDFKYEFIEKMDNIPIGMYIVCVSNNDGACYGIIDENGNEVIPTIYKDLISFSENLAPVLKDDKYGYINLKNEIIIPFKFDKADDFINGKAKVVISNNEYEIDKQGNIFY